jgi:DNA-binding transcriptional ArsR family regulator
MSQTKQNLPAIQIRRWPGLALTSALQTALFVREIPGISEDFERMAHSIQSDLADSIVLFLLTSMPAALFGLSLRDNTTHLDPEAFLKWLSSLSAEDLATSALDEYAQEKAHRHETVQSTETSQSESPAEWTRAEASKSQLEQAKHLLANPAHLKMMAVNTLRVFWEKHFRTIYDSHNAATQQTIDNVRIPAALKGLPLLLESLLGRSLQLPDGWADEHERILLVPFPFMGPYVVSMTTDSPEAMLILCFDADRAMKLRSATILGLDLAKLKALADETRLEILRFTSGSERFGGEIVTHLGISQPGVSRHLRLLTASGLLDVRQEGTSKFYSCCDRELDAIADGIRQLKSDAKSNSKGGNR